MLDTGSPGGAWGVVGGPKTHTHAWLNLHVGYNAKLYTGHPEKSREDPPLYHRAESKPLLAVLIV